MKKTIASVVLAIASTGAFAEEVNTQPVAQQPVAAQTVGSQAIQNSSGQWLWPVLVGSVAVYYIISTSSEDKPKIDDDTNATTDTVS